MLLSQPDPLGVPRDAAWAPTDDTARQRSAEPGSLFAAGQRWRPDGLVALGHQLTVNIATGGLVISARDLSMPYQSLGCQVARAFDAQEQHAQQAYLYSHPNTDPRIHLFANWQSAREALVSAVWDSTFPELLVADGQGGSAFYYRDYPDFRINTTDGAAVEERLRAYGVPGRTLAALGWSYTEFDTILRSLQGGFSVLSGDYRAETMVDPALVRLCRFDVITGTGYRYSSEFAYEQFIDTDGMRETTVQALLVDVVDALGHQVSFRPVAPAPPYRSYRLADGSGRAFRFDLSDHVDYLDGNNPGGQVKTYVVSQVTDETRSADNVISYGYGSGRLTEVRYPGLGGGPARRYRYDYDDRGRLVRITDPVGDSFAIEYTEDLHDADERLIPRLKVARLTDGEGNSAAYSYDHDHGKVSVTFTGTDGDTRTAVYSYIEDRYNTRQRYITTETIAVESGYSGSQLVRTSWQYSGDGRYEVDTVTDPLGSATSFRYNDFNQVTAQIDATGHERDYDYDVHAGPTAADPNLYDLLAVSETNADGDGNTFLVRTGATFQHYDAGSSPDTADTAQSTHRAATRTNELGAVTSFGYDDPGSFLPVRPTSSTDPLGKTWTRAYDATGSLLSDTDPEGNTWRRAYNQQGQLTSITDPNGFQSSRVYDAATGWLTDATDARGAGPGDPAHSVHYDWTAAGQRIQDRDATGATTDYAYYPSKRLRSVSRHDPAPRTITFAYDATGAPTGITDPLGHTTFFRSDEAGRVYATYRDDPASPSIVIRFDAAGHPVQLTDRNGQTTRYGYDALGRMTSIDEPDWPAGAPANPGKQVRIDYDRLGHRLRVSDSELDRDYLCGYDAAGNLTATTDWFGSRLRYAYDARNDLVALDDDTGIIGLRFGRDDARRLISVTDSAWQDPSRTFAFIRSEGPLRANLYRIEGPSGLATRFAYNQNRQVTRVSHERAGATVGTFGYDYLNDGLIGRTTGDHAGEYGYDGMKRLVRETDAGVEDAYDAAGNRLWRAAQAPAASQENRYDGDNRLVQSPPDDATFTYDGNGNLLQRQAPPGAPGQYAYDAGNRLRLAESGAVSVSYLYDIDGRLLQRRRADGAATAVSRYLYARGSILAQLDQDNDARVVYTRSDQGRLLRRRTSGPLQPAPGTDPHSLFYLHDGLDSVAGLLDGDGTARRSVSYDAWGKAQVQGPASAELFGYRQGFQDADTGLVNFGRRWYDAGYGRWISQDPLLADLLVARHDLMPAAPSLDNLYRYVGDNPLNVSDPTGLQPGGSDPIRNFVRKVVAAWMLGRGRGSNPVTGYRGTLPEEVQQKAPQDTEPKAEDSPEPELEPGAGEGAESPSSERIYQEHDSGSPGVFGWILLAGGAAIVGILALPEEAGGAVIYVGGRLAAGAL